MKIVSIFKASALIILSLQLQCCAQTKTFPAKSYAYFVVQIQGQSPVGGVKDIEIEQKEKELTSDKNTSASVDTTLVVYIVTTKKDFPFNNAEQNGKELTGSPLLIQNRSFLAGYKRHGDQVVILTTKDEFLWEIKLWGKKISDSSITIFLNKNGKSFKIKTQRLEELVLPAAM